VVADLVRGPSLLSASHVSPRPPLTRPFLGLCYQLALLRHTGPRQAAFVAAVDDWACALVPTASSVSLLFYGLLFQDPRFVVEACVHQHNTRRVW
jgi:hypothetical protein